MISAEIRAEIEQILTTRSRRRPAKVLIGMLAGLTNDEMAQQSVKDKEPITAESIAQVRMLVSVVLQGELVTAPSDARAQADIYRELLNHRRSRELQQYIDTVLAKLRGIDPTIPTTPLGPGDLGRKDTDPLPPVKPEKLCDDCCIEHAGECP